MKELHLISYPKFFDGELEHIIAILERTDVVFHLRKPEVEVIAYEAFVRQIPEAYYKRVILHSAYHLADDFQFRGLHFSTSKRDEANNVKRKIKISTSCHSLGEVISLSQRFSSCFLSPIFESISKEGYSANLDLEMIKKYLNAERKMSVIALGGIDINNISTIKAMGFDGAAVLGAIWGSNPEDESDFVERIISISQKLKD